MSLKIMWFHLHMLENEMNLHHLPWTTQKDIEPNHEHHLRALSKALGATIQIQTRNR